MSSIRQEQRNSHLNRTWVCRQGMTLTELLVATMLVAIVMVGAISVDFAVRSSRRSSSAYTLIIMQANTLMAYLTRDAMLATGTDADRGVGTWDDGVDRACVCFRHDVNDPSSFTDDQWICYRHGPSFEISRYEAVNSNNMPPSAWGHCAEGGAKIYETDPMSILDNIFVRIEDGGGRFEYIEIFFRTMPDPSLGEAGEHPMTNPIISLSTRVFPIGHSH